MTLRPAPKGYPIKLVRDRTASVINATGEPGELFYGKLPSSENFNLWLRRKLLEEVGEYLEGRSVDELADVLAVVETLARVSHGHTMGSLLELARGDERGGFDNAVMMYGRHPEFDGGGPCGAHQLGRNRRSRQEPPTLPDPSQRP